MQDFGIIEMKSKYSTYSDEELSLLLNSGDNKAEKAFAELYSRYSHKVYAYCLKILGNREDAGDVFQDTFVRFFNTAKQRPLTGNIGGYIITIARNLCLNYKRDRKQLESFEDYMNLSQNETQENMDNKEQLELIQSALDKLPIEYREAFVLRQYQGYSYQEIADITGDTDSTVKNRVWRAKEKIKSLLAPYLKDY